MKTKLTLDDDYHALIKELGHIYYRSWSKEQC